LELLPKALMITVLGMGLVFAAIVLLWGLMALLVKLTADPEEENESEKNRERIAVIEVPQAAESAIKVLAAAAAVATALVLSTRSTQHYPPETDQYPSPWKDAHRAMEINRRSRCFNK
jgi:Na+-transporting methylmalonyl-CoA/oxaloacetate decarboxylase gamma subunit